MFKIHQQDKWALREFLLAGGPGRRKWTQAELAAKPGSYWRARCRHTIPPPQELVNGVEAVMKKYERETCVINGDPLITEDVQHVHELQVKLMQEGLLSGEPFVTDGQDFSAPATALLEPRACFWLVSDGMLSLI